VVSCDFFPFQILEAVSEIEYSGVYSNYKGTETIYLRLDFPEPVNVSFIAVEIDTVALPIESAILSGERSGKVAFEILDGEILLKAQRILYNSDAPKMVETIEYPRSSEVIPDGGVVVLAIINGKEIRTPVAKLGRKSILPKP